MNKDLLDEITDIEVLKVNCRQLNKLVIIKENRLEQQEEEIERLNNIIEEIIKICEENEYITLIKDIKRLKGSDKVEWRTNIILEKSNVSWNSRKR